jgi:hypothetical protein
MYQVAISGPVRSQVPSRVRRSWLDAKRWPMRCSDVKRTVLTIHSNRRHSVANEQDALDYMRRVQLAFGVAVTIVVGQSHPHQRSVKRRAKQLQLLDAKPRTVLDAITQNVSNSARPNHGRWRKLDALREVSRYSPLTGFSKYQVQPVPPAENCFVY